MTRRARIGAVAMTVAAATLWGTSFAVNDIGLRSVDPFTFVFARFALAGVVALGLAALTGNAGWHFAKSPTLWLLGAMNAAAFLGQYVGQCWTTPARTALFVNSNVLIVAALSAWVARERPARATVIAAVVAVVGVAFLTTGQGQPGACGVAWWGDALVGIGAVAWAGYVVTKRHLLVGGAGVISLLAWTFLVTAAWLLPFLAFAKPPAAFTWPTVWPVLYSAFITTGVAYGLWAAGLRHVPPTASILILLLEVPIAVAITLGLGRESFTVWHAVGGVLLLGAVLADGLRTARDETVAPEAQDA